MAARNIEVIDPRGEHLFWVNEDDARGLLSARAATLYRQPGSPRKLRAVSRYQEASSGTCGWMFRSHWPSPFDTIAALQRREVIQDSRDSLADENRLLIRLRYWNGLTFTQIAAAFEKSEDAVIAQHHRTLARLKLILGLRGVKKLEDIL